MNTSNEICKGCVNVSLDRNEWPCLDCCEGDRYNEPQPEADRPEQIPAVVRRSAAPYITIKEWEEENGKEYPTWAPIWYYDDYAETWDFAFWREYKEYYEKERKQPPSNHAMWAIEFEPLVMDINLPFPRCNDGIKYPVLIREISAE